VTTHDGNTVKALQTARDFAQRGPLQTTLDFSDVGGVSRLLAGSMAVKLSDVLMSILVMPLSLSVLIAGHWPFNKGSCLYHGYTATTLGSASLLILTLTSANRHFKVVRPNQYRAYFKVKPRINLFDDGLADCLGLAIVLSCDRNLQLSSWQILLYLRPRSSDTS